MRSFCTALAITLYLVSLTCHGQQSESFITGYVKDVKNNAPVLYANVYLKSNAQHGVISNMHGKFRMLMPDKFSEDTLIVSFVGYETAKIHLSKKNLNDSVRVFLKEAHVALSEILVLGTTPLTFLKEAAKITSEKCVSPAVLSTYYREFVSKNGHYTTFADGMVDYYVERRGSQKNKVQVRVRESRARTRDVELETPSAGGNFDIRQVLDMESLPYFYDAQRKLEYILETGDNGDFYDFELYELPQDGHEFYKVVFTPKKTVQKLLFEGTFLIDKETSVIHTVHYVLPESHKAYAKVHKLPFGFRVQPSEFNVYVQYQSVGDNYHLKYVKATASLHVFDKRGLDITHNFSNEMLVNEIDYQRPAAFKAGEVWHKKSIAKRGNNYSTDFWERQQVLMATEAEQKIIESLSGPGNASN